MEERYSRLVESAAGLDGRVIRRVGSGKDQQGRLVRTEADGALVVTEVVDITAPAYVAQAGILRLAPGDQLYVHSGVFDNTPRSWNAAILLEEWKYYKEFPELRQAMREFMTNSYSPEQILAFRDSGSMKGLFVPLQQKFKLGRFEEKVDFDGMCLERFRAQLAALHPGDHLTYVALLPLDKKHRPLFYSIGTKPHEATCMALAKEPFHFDAKYGGHIKALPGSTEQKKILLVDAGSNYKGQGNKTPLATAKLITDQMALVFPEHTYTPLPGRDAFGEHQSY